MRKSLASRLGQAGGVGRVLPGVQEREEHVSFCLASSFSVNIGAITQVDLQQFSKD